MLKRIFILISILLCVLLTGCMDKTEEVEIEPINLRPIESSVAWDSLSINSITPVTAFSSTESELYIYPYNNSDRYVSITKFLISENNYWSTAELTYAESGNVIKTDSYSLITLPSGQTMGYVKCDEEYSYLVSSDLPSSYVKAVLEQICNAGL